MDTTTRCLRAATRLIGALGSLTEAIVQLIRVLGQF
jgi:hypothetical protein